MFACVLNVFHGHFLLSELHCISGLIFSSPFNTQSSGEYSLGPRAMLELHPYLKRVYEDDIVDCMMCRDIVIKVDIGFVKSYCTCEFPAFICDSLTVVTYCIFQCVNLTQGQCCNQCEGKIHMHCAARYFGQRQR